MNIIDIARECGAREAVDADDGAELIELTESQLTAFADRIKAEERARCVKALEAMHLKQLGRATEHNYFAVAAQVIGNSGKQVE